MKGLAGAAQEALEVIGRCDAGFDFDVMSVAAFADLDKGRKKVVHPVAQLLDVGVLVGGSFVAVDRDALVHDLAVKIVFLAERLHDELLEVFRKQHERILVG